MKYFYKSKYVNEFNAFGSDPENVNTHFELLFYLMLHVYFPKSCHTSTCFLGLITDMPTKQPLYCGHYLKNIS